MSEEMRDGNIVTLYTNKGEKSDCNNYRGIHLLSIVGKVCARVVLNRIQSRCTGVSYFIVYRFKCISTLRR